MGWQVNEFSRRACTTSSGRPSAYRESILSRSSSMFGSRGAAVADGAFCSRSRHDGQLTGTLLRDSSLFADC